MFRTCLPAGRYKENLVNRVNPVKKVPPQAAKFNYTYRQMNILNPSTTHPSLFDLIIRFCKILKRYGLSSKKMESNLTLYLLILQKHNVVPSFPITAKVLSKYPKLINRMMKKGAELAVHGYKHIDYSRLSEEEILRHLEKAVKIFQEQSIPFFGFRFPYLRYNNKGTDILGKFFCWDSSHTILWNGLEKTRFSKRNWQNYQHVLKQYNYRNSDNCCSLPRFQNNVLELPVSLPDDDLLIDRLGIKHGEVLAQIWGEILEQTYSRGELYTLQLHPERIPLCKDALDALLRKAQTYAPPMWIAQLGEISRWWRERRAVKLEISRLGRDRYEVKTQGSERSSVLVKDAGVDCATEEFFGPYVIAKARQFVLHSHVPPVLGIAQSTSEEYIDFLKAEGFEGRIGCNEDSCGMYLETDGEFKEESKRQILDTIEHTPGPLIRIWRWPMGARSALAITGDIDSITLVDFWNRILGG